VFHVARGVSNGHGEPPAPDVASDPAPALAGLVGGGVAACGKSTSTNSSSPPASGSASASSGTGTSATAAGSCSAVGTRHIPKTRVVGALAISAGAFHRYIYKPIKSGTFSAESKTRKVLTLAKGAVAAGAIYHFMGNAVDNARSDPTLCKYVPTMDQTRAKLNTLSTSLRHGDTSQISGTQDGFSRCRSRRVSLRTTTPPSPAPAEFTSQAVTHRWVLLSPDSTTAHDAPGLRRRVDRGEFVTNAAWFFGRC
jgi:hypothetical protein